MHCGLFLAEQNAVSCFFPNLYGVGLTSHMHSQYIQVQCVNYGNITRPHLEKTQINRFKLTALRGQGKKGGRLAGRGRRVPRGRRERERKTGQDRKRDNEVPLSWGVLKLNSELIFHKEMSQLEPFIIFTHPFHFYYSKIILLFLDSNISKVEFTVW